MTSTLRQFRCRDDLWTRVEALAERRSISPDEVVQAALIQMFSRKRGSEGHTVEPGTSGARPLPGGPPPVPATPRPMPSTPPSAGNGTPSSVSTRMPMPSAPARRPQPTPSGARLPPPAARGLAAPPPLYLFYDGQWYAIDQDEFIIGRGSKYSDLAIKDANISRRHCAVVRDGDAYVIRDLESTNGVEFNGQRVDNHRIEEGSSYRLCDHEIRFSFVPPA